METDKFLVTNIRQYLNSDNPKLGEDKLVQELSGFSCPKNWDIENLDLCQYFGHKKLKVYVDFFNSSSSFCCGVL